MILYGRFNYEKEHGVTFASRAADSIIGGIEAVAFHDKMKGHYKDMVRSLGSNYKIPAIRHQHIRKPENLELG